MLGSTKIKLLSFVAMSLGIFSLVAFSQPASAVESLEEVTQLNQITFEDAKKLGEITYQDNEVFMVSFGNNEHIAQLIAKEKNTVMTTLPNVRARSSVSGPGGTARINGSGDRRQIFWSVKPNTTYPWAFKGNINIKFNSGRNSDFGVYGTGALGSSYSGYIGLVPNNGGYAKLTGYAESIDGYGYNVLPGVGTWF